MDSEKKNAAKEIPKSRLRILHFNSEFFPEYSGSATRLFNLLSKLNDEIILITSDRTLAGKEICRKEETFGNISVKRVSVQPNGIINRIPPLRYVHSIFITPKILYNSSMG